MYISYTLYIPCMSINVYIPYTTCKEGVQRKRFMQYQMFIQGYNIYIHMVYTWYILVRDGEQVGI